MNLLRQTAHDDNAHLFGFDQELSEFFATLQQKAKNSFVFFQSDHGIRYGPVRDIPIIGEVEDNNPFLYVIVPEKLRNNPTLMEQLNTNSRHLISQFDLYASAVQIAKFSQQWNQETKFNEPASQISDRKLIGSSIFHSMKQPRNCDNLHIPFDYCICQRKSIDLDDPNLSKQVAQKVIDSINRQLDESPYSSLCKRHTLSSKYPIRLEEFVQEDSTKQILKVKFETLPGEALYQSIVQRNVTDQSLTLMQSDFPRVNIYADQAKCIPEGFFKNYCIC
ncbi:hypothetical protein M3Y97_00767900 [Aphelenchoides bicaudatus]|nr:hypothetical protein M3Y97_00767900 [Aphelenchoides bicaudatus]